jgi:ATP adenylyltransferase
VFFFYKTWARRPCHGEIQSLPQLLKSLSGLPISVTIAPMPNSSLYAPWRMDYIRNLDKPAAGCFLCEAAKCMPAEFRSRMILWRNEHSVVLINRYPYTSGHILVAPLAHVPDLEQLSDAQLLDIQKQTAAVVRLLKRAMSPQGFNLGVNLGRPAGAGVPDHLHQHIVPRWAGDTNFISVVGQVRIVPQAMEQLYDELVNVMAEMKEA